jgi:hypothetical protein
MGMVRWWNDAGKKKHTKKFYSTLTLSIKTLKRGPKLNLLLRV